ncbi:MAG: rod shape-determining protein MreC [Oscillospiraceae bacterium]|nr:rod shape-determining protein MreC [Oscillospiraceae bacterium]
MAEMQDFFKSSRFKILSALLVVLFAFMLRATLTGGASVLVSEIFGMATQPFVSISSSLSKGTASFLGSFVNTNEISRENEELREQVRELNEKLAAFEQYKHENEYLREYLEVKEQNPDFKFETAEVIQRDPNNRFCSFMIDKGSLSGIEYLDPVITADGLVGRVVEVGYTYSKVATILDVEMDVGCYDVRTRDTGVLEGDAALAADGMCKMSPLPRETVAAKGDLILTTGIGGLFPKDIMIGKIQHVSVESHGKSTYAVVKPAAQIATLTDVMVITDFLGQGGINNAENYE